MKVIILRGIPGCGKSRCAEDLLKAYQARAEREGHRDVVAICSADHYMLNEEGKYEFKREWLQDAHKSCLLKFMDTCLHPKVVERLVVDNTNIRAVEVAPYYQIAQAFGHEVGVLTVVCDPLVASTRNVHGVEADKIYQMHLMLEDETRRFPSWWKHEIAFSSGGA
jgi:tRNA uridine 5-carbamoylmethylation protein Kti12